MRMYRLQSPGSRSPSPRSSRGEGRGEGLLPRIRRQRSARRLPPHPDRILRCDPASPRKRGEANRTRCTALSQPSKSKRPGLLPAFACFRSLMPRSRGAAERTSVRRGALGRARRPRLDQGVVVDGLALRLLVGKLALRRNVAVLGRLGEPVLGGLLLVELRTAGTLHARLLETFEHRVLGGRKRIHRLLRRFGTGRRIADVLPPQLRELRIVR